MGALPFLNACLNQSEYLESFEMHYDLHGIFTLTLSAIRVDRRRRQSFVEEEVIEVVDTLLAIHEDHDASRGH